MAKHFYKEMKVAIPNSPHKVILGSLGSAQEARSLVRIQDYKPLHYMKALRVEQLAYAIVEVNGGRFDNIEETAADADAGEFYEAQVDRKRRVLDLWPDQVVNFLFIKLCELQSEVDEAVGQITHTPFPVEPQDDSKEASKSPATDSDST